MMHTGHVPSEVICGKNSPRRARKQILGLPITSAKAQLLLLPPTAGSSTTTLWPHLPGGR